MSADMQASSSSEYSKRESLDDIRKQYNDVMAQLSELRQFSGLKEHYTDIVKLVQELTQHIQSSYQREIVEPLSSVMHSTPKQLSPSQAPVSKATSLAPSLPFSTGSSPTRRPSLTDEDITRSYENYKDLLEAQTMDLKDQFEEIIRLDDPAENRGSMLSTRYWMEYAKEKEIQLKLSKRNTYKILLNTIKIEKENRKLHHELNAANAKIEELTKALAAQHNTNTNQANQSRSAPHTVRLNNNINIHFTNTPPSDKAPETKENVPVATSTTEADVGAERTNKNAKPKVAITAISQLNRATNNSSDNVPAQIMNILNANPNPAPVVKEQLSGPATLDVDKVTQALLAWQQKPAPRKFATYSDSSDTDSDSSDEEQPQVNSRINLSQRQLNVGPGQRRSSVTFGSATIIQTQVVSKDIPAQKRPQAESTEPVDDDELTQEDEDMKSRQFNVLEIVNDTDNEAEDTAPEDTVSSKGRVGSSSSNEFLKLLDEEDYKQSKRSETTQPLVKVQSVPTSTKDVQVTQPIPEIHKEQNLAKPYFVSMRTVPVRPNSMSSLNYKSTKAVDEDGIQSAPTSPGREKERTKSMKVKKDKCAVQ